MSNFGVVKRIRDQMYCTPLEREAADIIEQLQAYITHLETEWVLTVDLAEARSSFTAPPEDKT